MNRLLLLPAPLSLPVVLSLPVALLLAACAAPAGPTTSAGPASNSTPPSSAPAASASATPTPTPTPSGPVANAVCKQLSFYLDPALGSGVNCTTIPESSGADLPYFDLWPAHVRVVIKGYPLASTFHEPHIDLYPIARFGELAPEPVSLRRGELEGLIAGGKPGNAELPLLPIFNAGQIFRTQYALLQSSGSKGIRFLSEYAQYSAPINNKDLFWTYQGLSPDGKYWISAILPISHASLQADGTTPPPGQSWDQFAEGYPAYLADVTKKLGAQAGTSFKPSVPLLDALAMSIKVAPA